MPTKKTTLLLLLLLLLFQPLFAQPPWNNGSLIVSPDGRFLQHKNGTPFFWQGDIAWLLLQRMSREEMRTYFGNRKAKGFNVVQCAFLQFYSDKNVYGDSAYLAKDITLPSRTTGNEPADSVQYDFWDHADYAVQLAAENGIYLAIVPVWGQLVKRDSTLTKEKAEKFAADLAGHFNHQPNIIWLNGGAIQGDIRPDIWEAIGSTIKKNAPDQLMTFHPFGRTQSSTWFHGASWLDFNMYVSGHRNYEQDNTPKRFGEDNWRYVLEDVARSPVKPTIDGESSFESTPQGLHDHSQPYWNAGDVRRFAYWSVFAGAFGHTYGQNTVRQVYKKGVNKPESGARLSFHEALDDTGSFQMKYLKNLILSRPYFERVNNGQAVVDNGERYDRILVCQGKSYLFAYTFTGRSFTLQAGMITGSSVKAWWYNPRNGTVIKAGKYINKGSLLFDPPGEKANGNDWVLILDDWAVKFKKPGTVK